MQDVLLLAAVAAVFVFGWFLMDKLDRFLESNRHMQEGQLSSASNTLRLGFCDPTAADSIADVLAYYAEMYPDISVRIYCGTEAKLLKSLSTGRSDVIFLPQNTEIPANMEYNSRIVSLNRTPVRMKYGGLPLEPIADGHIIQKVLWIGEAASAFAGCL